jgi:hypothetical protein
MLGPRLAGIVRGLAATSTQWRKAGESDHLRCPLAHAAQEIA